MMDRIAARTQSLEMVEKGSPDPGLAISIETHRRKMIAEALKVLARAEITPEDVTTTFLMRHLLIGLFSKIPAEKAAALNSLLTIKGLKSNRPPGSKQKKKTENDHVHDLMDALRGET